MFRFCLACTEEGFAELLERSCQCGISGAHLAGNPHTYTHTE